MGISNHAKAPPKKAKIDKILRLRKTPHERLFREDFLFLAFETGRLKP
jgi:hypothetical protein